MHQRLTEILAYLAHVRADLANIIETTPIEALSFRPAPNEAVSMQSTSNESVSLQSTTREAVSPTLAPRVWYGAQIVHHLGAVEGSITKLLERLFADALSSGLPDDRAHDSLMHSLDHFNVTDRRARRVEAPERLQPPAEVSLVVAWESLQRVRERTHRAVATVDGRDLTRIAAPHPLFGPINGYEWVLIIGQHEERHLHQLRDTLKR